MTAALIANAVTAAFAFATIAYFVLGERDRD